MACGDGFERVAQVGVGIDAIQLAGLDQGRDPCPAGAAFVVTAKECVLPVQGERTDEVLDRLLSISTRPSSRNTRKPSQWLAM